MITAVTGLPGSGKTLYVLWTMEKFVRAGRFCATNLRLKPACPFYDQVALLDDDAMESPVFDIVSEERPGYLPMDGGRGKASEWYRAFWHYMPPGVAYFISEADNYWDSMDYGRATKDARLYFKQHRKRGDDLVLDFQNIDNLYNRIRRMTQKYVVCEYTARGGGKLYQYLPRSWQRFTRAMFGHESLAMKSFIEDGYFSQREAERMFGWYDTDQLYGSPTNYMWGGVQGMSGGGAASMACVAPAPAIGVVGSAGVDPVGEVAL